MIKFLEKLFDKVDQGLTTKEKTFLVSILLVISVVGIAILVTTNVNGVIALASRAFALFYALQCLVAWESARKRHGVLGRALAFLALAVVCFLVFVFGVPSAA